MTKCSMGIGQRGMRKDLAELRVKGLGCHGIYDRISYGIVVAGFAPG